MTPTIETVVMDYIETIKLARSEHTARTYRNALNMYLRVLDEYNIDPGSTPVCELSEKTISWLAQNLKVYSSATEQLYLTAVAGFFEYLVAENLAEPNLPRMRKLISLRARRPGQRLPQFPAEDIEKILVYTQSMVIKSEGDQRTILRNLRDRAFLLTLADTGLRVHEACALRRGDIDWNEAKAIIIGKGNMQAVVRFSQRSLKAIQEYLKSRMKLDGSSGRPLTSLPIFARHDRGAGKKIKTITPTTGRNIVAKIVLDALGEEAAGTITPHSFRHYFVTTVLRGSGGNMKLAQELARHKNIAVTQRYAHLSDDELDRGYHKIFEDS